MIKATGPIYVLYEMGLVKGKPYTHFYGAFDKQQDALDALGTQFHDDLSEFDTKELPVKVEFGENMATIYEKGSEDEKGNFMNYHIYKVEDIILYKSQV